MKKLSLLFLILFAFFAKQGFSQNESSFRFGLRASPSIAWMKPDSKPWEGDGAKFKFGFGLIGEFTLADNYSFGTGFDVSYSGGVMQYTHVDELGSDVISDITYKLQYFDIPLTLKMETNEIGYLTYFGQIGVGLGMRLGAKADVVTKNTSGINQKNYDDEDFKDDINFFRASFIIGAGVEYSLGGTTSALLGLSFNNGLLKSDASPDNLLRDEKGDAKAINNYVSLHLGILF